MFNSVTWFSYTQSASFSLPNVEKLAASNSGFLFRKGEKLQVVTQRELTNQITKVTLVCKVSNYIVKCEASFVYASQQCLRKSKAYSNTACYPIHDAQPPRTARPGMGFIASSVYLWFDLENPVIHQFAVFISLSLHLLAPTLLVIFILLKGSFIPSYIHS